MNETVDKRFATPDKIVVEALRKAVHHAWRVARREHIKANRIERVNQFIVSVRRELSLVNPAFTKDAARDISCALTTKELWHDIGVLSPYATDVTASPLQLPQVANWVAQVSTPMFNDNDDIQYSFDELTESLESITAILSEAERINTCTATVAGQICDLFHQ